MALTSPAAHVNNKEPLAAIKYRPDIDGLRAIAVLAVVLFHYRVFPFSGGFIGVDVFFVISGYLITSIITSQSDRDQFSFLHFYTRRCLRILPAALFITLCSAVFAFFFLLPDEFANLGGAIKSLSHFTSNLYFMKTDSDYWNQSSLAVQPLLHTWSLSIEEQFYAALPLFIFGSILIKRLLPERYNRIDIPLITLCLCMALSFWYSVSAGRENVNTAFYFIASRAWELLAGAVLAMVLRVKHRPQSLFIKNVTGVSSLAVLGICMIFYDESMSFPGVNALLPCISTALIIYAGNENNQSLSQRILEIKVFVYIGLISYSLYLWHWPILVFFQSVTWKARGLPPVPVVASLFLTVLLACFTWKFVETPLRKIGHSRQSQRFVILASVVSLVALYCLGSAIFSIGKMKGLIKQPVPEVLHELLVDTRTIPGARCEGSSDIATVMATGGGCEIGDKSLAVINFALAGDSHARMWADGIDNAALKHHKKGLVLAHFSCIPLLGLVPPARRKDCTQITAAKMAFLQGSSIKNIVLAGYWRGLGKTKKGIDTLAAALVGTASVLKTAGKNVFVVLDVPELPDSQMSMFFALDSISSTRAGPTYASYIQQQGALNKAITQVAKDNGIVILNAADILCNGVTCTSAMGGKTFYRDLHHLTDQGSIQFNAVFSPLFEQR